MLVHVVLVEVIQPPQKYFELLLQGPVVSESLGFLLDIVPDGDHPLGKLGVVQPVLQLLEPLTDLHPLGVDPGHVEVVLQADHISSKLAIGFLALISHIKFLVQFIFKLLEVYVDVEVLQKAPESDFLGIGVGHVKLAQPYLAMEEMDAGDSFDVSQNGGVETFLFFLLLGDEDVFGQKLFE